MLFVILVLIPVMVLFSLMSQASDEYEGCAIWLGIVVVTGVLSGLMQSCS